MNDARNSDSALTPTGRVLRAINHQATDRPPLGELCIDPELVATCLGRSAVGFAEQREFFVTLGLDLICLPPPSLPTDILTADRWKCEGPRWDNLERWRNETDAFVFATINGGFSWATAVMGFTEFMLAVARGAETVREIFDRTSRMNAAMVRDAVDKGAQAIMLADDIAHKAGPFVPISFLEDCYFPALQPVLETTNSRKVPVFFHSDGGLQEVLPLIADVGFAGLHCLDESAGMDLAQVKREYGARLCLWGNLDPTYLVQPQGVDEIETEVNRIMITAATGGGFIFGTTSGLFRGMRCENLCRAYGKAVAFRDGSSGPRATRAQATKGESVMSVATDRLT